MTRPTFPDLALAHRGELFAQLLALPADNERIMSCTFDGSPGWVVSEMPAARRLLTSSAGRKSRPTHSQRLLGGVGARQGPTVRQVKRHLIDAMAREASRPADVAWHLHPCLDDALPEPSRLTEALSAALLTQLTGRHPGSVDGAALRRMVQSSWVHLESEDGGGPADDDLAAYLVDLVRASKSLFLQHLREHAWADRAIAEELRGMVLAGWGSTTAATLSALSLDAGPVLTRVALDEVLRLYPPSFMIARRIVEPPPDPLPFESGDIVLISPWLIHRDQTKWSAPQCFDPARWRHQQRDRWFVPFGLGPRRCPAAAFARAQVATAVTWYAQRNSTAQAGELTLVEGRSPALKPRSSG